MSFFSKISKALGGKDKDADAEKAAGGELKKELETLNKDGRLHARYVIEALGIATLKLHDEGIVGAVKDISYGGMAVRFSSEGAPLPEKMPQSVHGTFTLLDQSIACRMQPVRLMHQNAKVLFAGFSMLHDTSDTLIFLRELIEPLRCGKTLVNLAPEMRQDKYKGLEWITLRGDGPTDLLLKSKPDGSLDEALLTFRLHEAYCEVSYKNGKLKTGRMLDRPGDSGAMGMGARMASTADLEKFILRTAIYILTSVPAECRKNVQPLLKDCMQGLGLTYADGAIAPTVTAA